MNPAIILTILFMLIAVSYGIDKKNVEIESERVADADMIANDILNYKRCIGEFLQKLDPVSNEYGNFKELETKPGSWEFVFDQHSCPDMDWYSGPQDGVTAILTNTGANSAWSSGKPVAFIYFDPAKSQLHQDKAFLPLVIEQLNKRTGKSLSVGTYR